MLLYLLEAPRWLGEDTTWVTVSVAEGWFTILTCELMQADWPRRLVCGSEGLNGMVAGSNPGMNSVMLLLDL